MDSNAILHEVQQLYNVSDRLDSLAEQHPLVSEALIGISGSVRNTATLLEVVVAMKLPTLAEMVGTTRSRVSFFMNRFRKLGFVDYGESGLQVHSSLLNIVLHD